MAHYLFNFTKKGATKGRTLREQAGDLLHARMWGIGPSTANRDRLAPGDDVLIYVGAPESSFVGHARLATGVHTWDAAEGARYPGDMDAGVAFEDAVLWGKPVPIASVLPDMVLHQTNPQARFFGGVVRITEGDHDLVRQAGGGASVGQARPQPATPAPVPPADSSASRLFEVTETLKKLIAEAGTRKISELDTRALLIDKYLEALEYRDLSDVRRDSPVDAGTYPDYVLYLNGEPAIGLEAKRLGAPLGPKEAAQAVAYCSGLGVRWAALTDGRYLKVYDAPLLGMPPHEREILSIDLAGYEGRDEFDALVWPRAELIAKSQLQSGMGLERWVARESARELLTTPTSRTVRTLRKELDEAKGIKLGSEDLSRIVEDLVG